jgi:aminodeoxyfutalosine deaminase
MRKFTSHLIHNGTHFLPTPSTIICHDNGTIVDVLLGQKLDDAQELSGLICPGFINTHCHLELSYLQNAVPQNTGLVHFISTINTTRNSFTTDIILQAIADAEHQMIANGIVAVGDISNTNNTITQKQKQNLHYHTFVEVAGVLDAIADNRYADAQQLQQQFKQLHTATIVPHAPYSVSQKLFSLINATNYNSPISIHNQECQAEDDLFRNASGELIPFLQNITNQKFIANAHHKSSLQYYLPSLQNQSSILFVHNTFTAEADILFAKNNCANRYWVLCPNANLYIENRLPLNLSFLQNQAHTICIGTDSLASNTCLSIYAEIQTLFKLSTAFTTEQLLRFATSNGAQALQMKPLGNIEIGKQPGLINISNWIDKNKMPDKEQINKLI